MTDAWMKRGGERQRFLEDIKRLILDEERESHESRLPQYAIHAVILEYLSHKDDCNTPFIADSPSKVRMRGVFHQTILPLVDEFARDKVEGLSLISELFVWTGSSVAHFFQSELMRLEIHHPEKVLGQHTANEVD